MGRMELWNQTTEITCGVFGTVLYERSFSALVYTDDTYFFMTKFMLQVSTGMWNKTSTAWTFEENQSQP